MATSIKVRPIAGNIGARSAASTSREVPPEGGDTLFANAYLAYEALSEGMKRMLDGVIAVNSSAKADVSGTREDRVKDTKRGDAKTEYVGAHPVVRTHPETGRKALSASVMSLKRSVWAILT